MWAGGHTKNGHADRERTCMCITSIASLHACITAHIVPTYTHNLQVKALEEAVKGWKETLNLNQMLKKQAMEEGVFCVYVCVFVSGDI